MSKVYPEFSRSIDQRRSNKEWWTQSNLLFAHVGSKFYFNMLARCIPNGSRNYRRNQFRNENRLRRDACSVAEIQTLAIAVLKRELRPFNRKRREKVPWATLLRRGPIFHRDCEPGRFAVFLSQTKEIAIGVHDATNGYAFKRTWSES